ATLSQLSVYLRKILIHTSACSIRTTGGDSSEMDSWEKRTVEAVVRIAEHSIEWAKRDYDFPSGAVLAAKTKLRSIYGATIDKEAYNNTAQI
ncbi:hypothetical protein PFISCL1PPCAC_25792, partial [Pristionchus fissidentatus]